VFPASRLGPAGDVAKINCNTCHQGQPKPLNGVSMLPAHPELARIRPPPPPPAAVDPAAVDGTATPPAGPSAADVAAAGEARDAAAAAAVGSGGA
jgi:photosynthetic reaction center cytochrome c subunit